MVQLAGRTAYQATTKQELSDLEDAVHVLRNQRAMESSAEYNAVQDKYSRSAENHGRLRQIE